MHSVEGFVPDGRHRASCMGTAEMDEITFVGLDVHKATVCVAIAESGRGGEVRQIGVFENRPEVLSRMAARLGKGGRRLSFCYHLSQDLGAVLENADVPDLSAAAALCDRYAHRHLAHV